MCTFSYFSPLIISSIQFISTILGARVTNTTWLFTPGKRKAGFQKCCSESARSEHQMKLIEYTLIFLIFLEQSGQLKILLHLPALCQLILKALICPVDADV
jgi:hypothetical protein